MPSYTSGYSTSYQYKPVPPSSPSSSRRLTSGRKIEYTSPYDRGGSTYDRGTYGGVVSTYEPAYRPKARPLPSGPGPLDYKGNRIGSDRISSTHYKPRTSSTSTISSGPVKARHDYATTTASRSSYPSTYEYDTHKPYAKPDDTYSRNRTLSTTAHDSLTKDFDSLSMKDEGYGTLPLSSSRRRQDSCNVDKRPRSRTHSEYQDSLNNGISKNHLNSSGSKSSLISVDFSPGIKNTSPIRGGESREEDSPNSKLLSSSSRQNSVASQISNTSGISRHSSPECNIESRGLIGLRNLGNTCFMNCVLQCLSNTKLLCNYCVKEDYHLDINKKTSSMKGTLINAYANLMSSMWKTTDEVHVSPNAFKSQIQKFAPRFMGYDQQDAQEFLRYLLMGLHDDVNRIQRKPKPIITNEKEEDRMSTSEKSSEYWKRYLNFDDSKIVDIFVGQLRSTLTCTSCQHPSVTFDPFWDLSVPLPKKSYGEVALKDCVNLFMKEETLDGDERPTCAKCKTRRRCTKGFSIQKFPKILVLHLKRFSQARYRSKLSTAVDFPTKLDLSAFSSEKGSSAVYNLYGVSNHSGSVYSGHYTAYCKHPHSNQWHYFNDSRVTKVPASQVVSPEAYVLFYELSNTGSKL